MSKIKPHFGRYARNQIYKPQRLGVVLREADLIEADQIEMALTYQFYYPFLSIGEILSIQGWINSRTADFFAKDWQRLVKLDYRKPLGYYLQKAGLLEEEDIKEILSEQQITQYRFGAIAVMKGHLKSSTLDFFLRYLFPEELGQSSTRSLESLRKSRQRQRKLLSQIINRRKIKF